MKEGFYLSPKGKNIIELQILNLDAYCIYDMPKMFKIFTSDSDEYNTVFEEQLRIILELWEFLK